MTVLLIGIVIGLALGAAVAFVLTVRSLLRWLGLWGKR